jgi:hypothetical protein
MSNEIEMINKYEAIIETVNRMRELVPLINDKFAQLELDYRSKLKDSNETNDTFYNVGVVVSIEKIKNERIKLLKQLQAQVTRIEKEINKL